MSFEISNCFGVNLVSKSILFCRMKSFFCKRVDSTNLEARRILKRNRIEDPFWLIADDQYAGKGHGNNQWESELGRNFTGSLVFFPDKLQAFRQFQLSKLVSLGIADFLELYLEDVKIKWPNDLYFKEHKIAGILIENEILGEMISLSIIGIGLNINQTKFISDAPNPVSLSMLTGIQLDLRETIDLICERVENRLESMSSILHSDLDQEYLRKLYRFKEFAPFKYKNNWIEARITGLGEYGELILEEKSGKSSSFGFNEVEFILP